MRYYLVVQSLHQLKGRYGEDADTIKGNCNNIVFLTSKELDLLGEISALCGEYYTSEGYKRKLISVSELQRLDKAKGEVLVLYGRKYPFITYLPDIDDYEMFKGYPSVQMPAQDLSAYKTLSLPITHYKIKAGALEPFKDE